MVEAPSSPANAAPRPPLGLPALVMRRALAVAVAAMLLATAVGLWRTRVDIADEVDAAVSLARIVAALGSELPADDAQALLALRQREGGRPLRHLRLTVLDAAGAVLATIGDASPTDDGAAAGSAVWRAVVQVHRLWFPGATPAAVRWPVARPGGSWTLAFEPSPESERREALAYLGSLLAVFAGALAAVLAVMAWNVRRALQPMRAMLATIAQIERGELSAARQLATMPVPELEAHAAALRHLGTALQAAQAERQVLSRRMLNLQEDERQRLARELHDEFGQRLTAMRVDCAWLARQTAGQPALRAVVDGMAMQCERVQQDIRSTLARLQPMAASGADPAQPGADTENLDRLAASLRSLVDGWSSSGGGQTDYSLTLVTGSDDGPELPWPVDAARIGVPVDLALAIYRISQEALTNVARHAAARRVSLILRWCPSEESAGDDEIDWVVCDDGVGLPGDGSAAGRGNGLTGMRERVWALGGALTVVPAEPAPHAGPRPGLRLQARFRIADAGAVGDG